MTSKTTYHLYTFFASSCAERIRIAANLKNIPLIFHYINLQTREHEGDAYHAVNPSGGIPTLVIERADESNGESSKFSIHQSVAILEYFEEVFPSQTPLLPPVSQPVARAHVRELMYAIAIDIAPPTNAKVAARVRKVRDSADDETAFAQSIFDEGFNTYERMLERFAEGKKYAAGDDVTLADVCLIPQVQQARFRKVDFGKWPLLRGLIERLEALEEFKRAAWNRQEDTPERFKVKD
ncbi:maleylacetoacetate isomerase maia [Byssothecium circinans]|uniref:Maleylacetoacetate isomerase maia n=1 Tax=Byssothecium circinans TaxID=147558 RepID=A0A6A5UDY6_9PLEO|nr:maleylacetoacetate isomerase maia [Byssothecium circinans]